MDFKGFTLPELIITLLVLLLLGFFFTPLFYDAMRSQQLSACSEQIATHIRYARRIAMAKGLSEEVIFIMNNPGNHSYRVEEEVSNLRERDPLDESQELFVVLRTSTGMPSLRTECWGLLFASVSLPGGVNPQSVIFDASGTPNLTGLGEVRLTTGSGHQRSIFVTQGTGAVVVGEPSS